MHLIAFQIIDPELAEAVLNSIYRHMWYLAEETVVSALTDPDVTWTSSLEWWRI